MEIMDYHLLRKFKQGLRLARIQILADCCKTYNFLAIQRRMLMTGRFMDVDSATDFLKKFNRNIGKRMGFSADLSTIVRDDDTVANTMLDISGRLDRYIEIAVETGLDKRAVRVLMEEMNDTLVIDPKKALVLSTLSRIITSYNLCRTDNCTPEEFEEDLFMIDGDSLKVTSLDMSEMRRMALELEEEYQHVLSGILD